MKKKMIFMLAVAMMLCGCGKDAGSSDEAAKTPSAASVSTETETSSTEETTAEETTEASSAEADIEDTSAAETETSAEEETSSTDETAETDVTEEDIPSEDVFSGTYSEEHAGRGIIEVTKGSANTYNIHIHWAGSALEEAQWDMSGEFNGRQVLDYSDCVKTHVIYNEDGTSTSEVEYTDGTGYLQISEEGEKTGLVWNDDIENAGADAFFVKN